MLPSLILPSICPHPSEGMYNCTAEIACVLAEPLCTEVLPYFKMIAAYFIASPKSDSIVSNSHHSFVTKPPTPSFYHPICKELASIVAKGEECMERLAILKNHPLSDIFNVEKRLKVDLMKKDLAETCDEKGQPKKAVKEDPKIAQARRQVYDQLDELAKVLQALGEIDLTKHG